MKDKRDEGDAESDATRKAGVRPDALHQEEAGQEAVQMDEQGQLEKSGRGDPEI